MTRRLLALFMLLPLLASSSAAADDSRDVKLPDKENFHLFLLVGQSNMAGRGKVADEDCVPNPRVLMLTKDNKWTPAVAPLHFDKPKIVGVGLGRTFGIEIASDDSDVTIGLIPCAVGGSPISSWEPGAFYRQTNSHPYDDALRRAKVALQAGTLKGILWHQGESDSKPPLAQKYEQKLHELIARLRKELNAADVPFIAGQLGQFEERPWDEHRQTVNAAHKSLSMKVAHAAFVSSDGLAHKGDEVHFDAASYRELGRRYAAAYRRLAEQP